VGEAGRRGPHLQLRRGAAARFGRQHGVYPGFSQRKSGTDAFFHTDWIGSTRYLTAGNGLGIPTGYRFDAFGNQTAGAGIDQTSLKFAGAWGYQSDVAMHLQLLGARYYDPEVGRFLSPDPIGFAGGLNLYGYCFNNPVGLVDPAGTNPAVILKAMAIGAAGGALIGGGIGGYQSWRAGQGFWSGAGRGALVGAAAGAAGVGATALVMSAGPASLGLILTAGAASGGAADLVAQGVEYLNGSRERYDPVSTGVNAFIGALTAGAGSGCGAMRRLFPRSGQSRQSAREIAGGIDEAIKNAAERSFRNNALRDRMSPEEREVAAQFYENLAALTRGRVSEDAALYNLYRAKFLRGEINSIPGTLAQFRKLLHGGGG
jgi:RHS repeat-associated protein